MLRGGDGPPCLVLHGIEGHEGWLAFHEQLAGSATVYAPSHPGYGHTAAPPWMTTVQHQAIFYLWLLESLRLDGVTLVGAGIGGWIAAYMAIMCPERLRRMVLISPAGIKPEREETLDIFVIPWRDVLRSGFANADSFERTYAETPIVDFGGIREAGRVMSMRMCFRPYLYDPALPSMLGKIQTPTLIVQGREDRIMPPECADQFARAIGGARAQRLDACGYFAHLDRPDDVAQLVGEFST
jgi:pimeloyl-ACP methyl ester carboxylesterase